MKQGYYTLTADVQNPTPDRRSKRRLDKAQVWPKGSVVFIYDRRGPVLRNAKEAAGERLDLTVDDIPEQGEIRFADGSQVLYSRDTSEFVSRHPEYTQGNAILDAVEESEKTLGLVLKQADWPAEDLLALLIDSGKITVADVDAIKTLDLTPEVDGNNWQVRDAATDAFRKRHGLS